VLRCLYAGFRNAAVALQLRYARLASLLIRDATFALLSAALGQRDLGERGLLGPSPRGASFLRLMRRTSFALAFGKLFFRGLNLGSLAFGSPNADLLHWTGCGQGIRSNAASNPGHKTNGSD